MKYIFMAFLASMASLSIAHAGSLESQLVFADTGSRPDSNEAIVRYTDALPVAGLSYNLGVEAKQPENAGNVKATVSGGVGFDVKAPAGFVISPQAELGSRFQRGNNFEFWGAGVTATRQIVGPLSAEVGFRYRKGFDVKDMDETRTTVGVSYKVNDRYTVGANLNRSTGTDRSDSVGVFGRVNF